MIDEQEFNDRVALLRRKDPSHALLPVLTVYTSTSVMYLRHAMRGLEKEPEEARPQVQRMGDLEQDEVDDPRMDELQMRLGQLYGRRFNLSNQFHDHTQPKAKVHDHLACANISDEIRTIQNKAEKVQRQVYHFRRTGEMLVDAPLVQREYEGLALGRRHATVAQNVRRWRTKIEREGHNTTQTDLQLWDTKLKMYERELEGLKGQIRQAAC